MNKTDFTDITLLKDLAVSLGYKVTNISTSPNKNIWLLHISNGNKFYIANGASFSYYPTNQRWHTALFKNKINTSRVLKELGYPCIESHDYTSQIHTEEELLASLTKQELTFPVIIKPSLGMRGRGIRFINNKELLTEVAVDLHKQQSDFCVQPIVPDTEYRVLFINNKVSIVHSKSHNLITGDGTQTVSELLKAVSDHDGVIDMEFVKAELEADNLTLNTVLEKGKQLITHLTSTTVDKHHNEIYYADNIPEEVAKWGAKLAKDLSASVIGIDIFASDLNDPKTYKVIELNSNPGFDYLANKFEGYEPLKEIWREIFASYFNEE